MGKEAGKALGATPIGGIATAGLGIYNIIRGSKEQRDAQKALENYQRQELNNAYDNVQVSTRGADLQREEASRLASSQVDALQGAGTRALVGGLGRVETGNQRVNLGIGANLDEQQKAIDQMVAEDDARLRMMRENREQNDINALSSQYQAGKQDANMGMGNVIQGFGSLANQFGSLGRNSTMQNSAVSQLQPMGTTQQVQPSTPLIPGLNPNQLNLRLQPRRSGLGVFDVSNYNL